MAALRVSSAARALVCLPAVMLGAFRHFGMFCLQARSSRSLSTAAVAEQNFPSYVLNVPATEVSTLGNGVRVATEVRLRDYRITLHQPANAAHARHLPCAGRSWRDSHRWCLH